MINTGLCCLFCNPVGNARLGCSKGSEDPSVFFFLLVGDGVYGFVFLFLFGKGA